MNGAASSRSSAALLVIGFLNGASAAEWSR